MREQRRWQARAQVQESWKMVCIEINLLVKVLLLLMSRHQIAFFFVLSGAVVDRLPESECASRARAADRTPGLVATQRSSIAVGRRW